MIHNIPLDVADGANTRGVVDPDGCTIAAASVAVRDAYWYASRLINAGWLIRRIGTTEEGGFFVAETPGRRVVSVDDRARPGTDPAAQFAKRLAALPALGAAEGRDYFCDLVRLLGEHAPQRQPATLTWRTWHIPGVPASLQPIPKVRAAYWFTVTLTDDYGWKLCEIGTATAAGGFIADIPGETIAIYPASMPDDRTAASALARLLAGMSAAEVGIVAALVDWHSGGVSSRGRSGWSQRR